MPPPLGPPPGVLSHLPSLLGPPHGMMMHQLPGPMLPPPGYGMPVPPVGKLGFTSSNETSYTKQLLHIKG